MRERGPLLPPHLASASFRSRKWKLCSPSTRGAGTASMPIHNVVYGGNLARETAGRAPRSASATTRSSRLREKGWEHEVPHSSLSGYSPRMLADLYTVSPQPPPGMWAGVGSPQHPAAPQRRTDEEQARHSQRRPATAKVRRKVPLRQLRWLRFRAGLS